MKQGEPARDAAPQAAPQAARSSQPAQAAPPKFEISREVDGQRVITVPNRSGGTDRIVINPDGVNINGREFDGTTTIAPDFRDAVPDGVVDIVQALVAMVVLCVVGLPLARAFGRWLDRRGSAAKVPSEVMSRLANIENAVETVAVEVERISEGQRFTARLLSERAQAEHIPR